MNPGFKRRVSAEGVKEALLEAKKLLEKAHHPGIPIIHIQHNTREGTPYDIKVPNGQLADMVKPIDGEPSSLKSLPTRDQYAAVVDTVDDLPA